MENIMTDNRAVQWIGPQNIITLLLILASFIANYTMLSAKVDNLADRIEHEHQERVLEDQKIRLEIESFYNRHDKQHQLILNELKSMREDLTYHLGKHDGVESE